MTESWQPLPEHKLVPYRALRVLPARSLLVLAPHPDDEILGCGGLLALAVEQGLEVEVIVVSDGAAGGDATTREAECRAAAVVIGYRQLQFWRLPDRSVDPGPALVDRLQRTLDARRPDWLLAPSPFEIHPDHRAVCVAAIDAAAGRGLQLGFYEVGQGQLPDTLVDITPVLLRKQRAMACFTSQLAVQRYDEQMLSLNRHRAYTLGAQVTHAEAYWFPAEADRRTVRHVIAAVSRMLALRLGVPEA